MEANRPAADPAVDAAGSPANDETLRVCDDVVRASPRPRRSVTARSRPRRPPRSASRVASPAERDRCRARRSTPGGELLPRARRAPIASTNSAATRTTPCAFDRLAPRISRRARRRNVRIASSGEGSGDRPASRSMMCARMTPTNRDAADGLERLVRPRDPLGERRDRSSHAPRTPPQPRRSAGNEPMCPRARARHVPRDARHRRLQRRRSLSRRRE